jgi:hypothetical protein
MSKLTSPGILFIIYLAIHCIVPIPASGQTEEAISTPMPTQMAAAKRVFISSTRYDGPWSRHTGKDSWQSDFKNDGDSDKHYSHFYAAMKSWGRYELVSTPSEADLVFEIRFTYQLIDCDRQTCSVPQLRLDLFQFASGLSWTRQ